MRQRGAMKLSFEGVLVVVLMTASTALLMMSTRVSAQEPPQGEKTPATHAEAPADVPKLADIVPFAAELEVRLVNLEKKMKDLMDFSAVQKKYEVIEAKTEGVAAQFEQLKNSEDYSQNAFEDLNNALKQEMRSFEETSKPVREAIRQLGEFREEWLAEKKRWDEWQNVFIQGKGLDQLGSTFEKANGTVGKALDLVLPRLEAIFRIQEKGGAVDARLKILAGELAGQIAEERRGALVKEIPPMLSSRYYSQFTSSEFWNEVKKGLYETSWPVSRFFAQHGWIILLQGLISLLAIIAIYKKQAFLKKSKRWQFLGNRLFSAGLLFGYMATVFVYEHQGAPAIFKQALSIVGVISFARLLGGLIEATWRKEFIYGLMVVLVIPTLLEMFNLPMPLFRLYTAVTALLGILFCWRWSKESRRRNESRTYSRALRAASLLLAIVMIVEVWGKGHLAFYLLNSLLASTTTVLFFILFMYMIRGGLEWLFQTSPMKSTSRFYSDTDALVRRVGLFIDMVIWGLLLVPAVLVIWEVYDNLRGAVEGLLGLGFDLGAHRISVGLLIVATVFIYGSFILSWVLQNLLLDKVLLRRGVERGVRVSIKRLVHYVLISIGFLLAISSLGLELTKLTILLSALGVGIGFGLQGVVNNFVSGLILLFERPVRVGDYIEMNGTWSEIQKIGLRATTVQTFDQADVIIPNADLVTNQVTNWTLRNRRSRLIVPVGVAYGSDIPLVIETLKASADHPMVSKSPAPQVLFLNFGESSLDFELRVWVSDVDQRLTTRSDLHQEIDRRFREAKIEIAFPQRDLRLRSVDESITLRSLDPV